MCINIVEIWVGIAYGQILSVFDKSYLPATCLYCHFQTLTSVIQWVFSMCINIMEIWFGMANG